MNLSGAADCTNRDPGRGQVRPPGIWSPTTGSRKPARPRVDNRVVTLARHRLGVHAGSAFFGWLTSVGVASVLVSLLGGAGNALGLAADEPGHVIGAVSRSASTGDAAATIGAAGAMAVAISLVAYCCGGYVAARLARCFGARQGLAVWLWGVAATLALAAAAPAGGARYSVLANLGLPRVPVDEGTLTTGDVVTLVASVLVSLAGAVLGGAAGTRRRRSEVLR